VLEIVEPFGRQLTGNDLNAWLEGLAECEAGQLRSPLERDE
jgi:hypothetical protein